ncbi:hypothetical protein HMPREF9212_0999 [Lactobacillus iners LactinV 03V1-b]|nr:hypothetical protein HMPREF9212_0999 [Lactobacillus iners LactinV 03V1-b]
MIYLIYLTGILIVIASVCLVISMDKKKNANLRKKNVICCYHLPTTYFYVYFHYAQHSF